MSRDELSEQQAADLLRRAAHLQARADNDHGPGLTLDEVKRAAHAAGIDPVYVEQAALGAGDDLPPSEPFLGMQTGSRRTRVVPGRVSDAEWGKMVAALRRHLGGTGTQGSMSRITFCWSPRVTTPGSPPPPTGAGIPSARRASWR